MRLNFLCGNHRNWLVHNPHAAVFAHTRAYEEGLELFEGHNFRAAANHAGCALETAQILIDADGPLSDETIGRYSDAGILLVYSLLHMQEDGLAARIQAGILSHLEKMLCDLGGRQSLVDACRRWMQFSTETALPGFPAVPPASRAQRHSLVLN